MRGWRVALAVAVLLVLLPILMPAAQPQPTLSVRVEPGIVSFTVAGVAGNVTVTLGDRVFTVEAVNGSARLNVSLEPGGYTAVVKAGGYERRVFLYVPERLGHSYTTVLVPCGDALCAVLVRASGNVSYSGVLRGANISGLVLPRPVPEGVHLVLWGPRGPVGYSVSGVNVSLHEPVAWLRLKPPPAEPPLHVDVVKGHVRLDGKPLFTVNSTVEAALAWGDIPGGSGASVWLTAKGEPGFALQLRLASGSEWLAATRRGAAAATGDVLTVVDGGPLDLHGGADGVVEVVVGVTGRAARGPRRSPQGGRVKVFAPKQGRVLVVGRGWARVAKGPVRVPGGFLVDNGTLPRAQGAVLRLGGGRALVRVEKEDRLTRFEVDLPRGLVVRGVERLGGGAVEYWFQNGSRLVFYDDPNRLYVVLYSVPEWWDPGWHYRVPIVVEAGTPNLTVVRVQVNLTRLLALLNVSGTPDNNSLRVVDDRGRLVPQQFYNASEGVLWFVTDTAAASDTRYYLYFDILENGAKPPLDTFDLNLGFESGATWWSFGSANTGGGEDKRVVDACVEGSTVSVSDTTAGQTVTADNTAHSGCNWTLIGYRSNEEDGASGVHEEVWVSRVFGVPVAGGNFTFWFRIQGWDSKLAGYDAYDYMRILVNGSDIPYTSLLYVDNTTNLIIDDYGVGRAYSYSYDVYQDLGWRLATFSLDSYAGSVVNVTIVMRFYVDNRYKTWLGVDDAQLPVYNASLNYSLVEAFGVNASVHPQARTVNVAGYESLITAKLDATASNVTARVYDACGRLLANLTLYDDGTHGDPVAGDLNYSVLAALPQGCPGNWSVVVEARDNSTSLLSPLFDGLAHIPGQGTEVSEQCFFNVGNWSGKVYVEVRGTVREDLGVLGVNDSDPGVPGATVGLFNDTNGDGVLDPGDALLAAATTGADGSYSFLIGSGNGGRLYFVAVNSTSVNTTRGLSPGYAPGDIWGEETWQTLWNGSSWAVTEMFGGRNASLADNWSAGVYEHYAAVNATLYWGGPVDFAFSFDVVVNVEPGGQGSLAQFLNNSAAIEGPDEMRFVPMVPPNEGDAEGSWWRVELRGPIPQLTGGTVVNGTALWPNMTVRDANPGYMLNGAYSASQQAMPVGTGPDGVPGTGDEPLLPGFPRPELEVDLWGRNFTVAAGAGDVVLAGVALYNGSGRGVAFGSYAAVYVPPGTGPVVLRDVYLGLRANGSCGWNPRYGLRVDGDARVLVNHSYIGCNGYGILAYYWDSTRPSGLVVEWSEIFANGRTPESPDGDGVAAWNGNVTVMYSFLHGNGPSTAGPGADRGAGLEAYYPWASNITLYEDTVSGNAYHGVRLAGGAGAEGPVNVSHTVISGNGGPGILLGLEGGAAVNLTLTGTSIFNNTGLAVDICLAEWANGDGVTGNDGALNSSQPDWGVDYPVLTAAYLVDGGSKLYVEGYVGNGSGSPVFAGARVDVYLVNTTGLGDNLTGNEYGSMFYGEATAYLGSLSVNATGWFRGFIDLSALPAAARPVNGSLVSAATWLPGNGTSELGPDAQALVFRPSNASTLVELGGTGNGSLWNLTVTLRNGADEPLLYGQAAVRLPPGASASCSLPAGMDMSCTALGSYQLCVFTAPYMPPLSTLTAQCNVTPAGPAWGDVRGGELLTAGVDPARRGATLQLPLALALAAMGLAAARRRRLALAAALAALLLLAARALGGPQFPLVQVYENYTVTWRNGPVATGDGVLRVYNPTPDTVFRFALSFTENPGLPSNPLLAGPLAPRGSAQWSYKPPGTPPLQVWVSPLTLPCGARGGFTITLRSGAPVRWAVVTLELPGGWSVNSVNASLGEASGGRVVVWRIPGMPGGEARLNVSVRTGAAGQAVLRVRAGLEWGYACELASGAWAVGPAAVSVTKEAVDGGFNVTASFTNLAGSLVYVLRRVTVYRNGSPVHVYLVNETLGPGETWTGEPFRDAVGGVPVYYAEAEFRAVPAANGSTVPLSAIMECTSSVTLVRNLRFTCAAPPRQPVKPKPYQPPPAPSQPGPPGGGGGGGGAPGPARPARKPVPVASKRGWRVDDYTLGFEIRIVNRGGNGTVVVTDLVPEGFRYVSATPMPERVEPGRIVWRVTLPANGSFTARVYMSSGWPLCGTYGNTVTAGGSGAEAAVEAPCGTALLVAAAAASLAVLGGALTAGFTVLPVFPGRVELAADYSGLKALVEKGLLPLAGSVAVPAPEVARALADPEVGALAWRLVESGVLTPVPCRGGEGCLAEAAERYGAFFVTGSLGAALECWGRGLRGIYVSGTDRKG